MKEKNRGWEEDIGRRGRLGEEKRRGMGKKEEDCKGRGERKRRRRWKEEQKEKESIV